MASKYTDSMSRIKNSRRMKVTIDFQPTRAELVSIYSYWTTFDAEFVPSRTVPATEELARMLHMMLWLYGSTAMDHVEVNDEVAGWASRCADKIFKSRYVVTGRAQPAAG